MLRTRNMLRSLWELALPVVRLRLPADLERVDAWLDDEWLFVPFLPRFSLRRSRPIVPIEKYLRLLFLEHCHQLGYESLRVEVFDADLVAVLSHRHRRPGADPDDADKDHQPVRCAGGRCAQ